MPERTLCSQGDLIEVLNKPTPLIYAPLFFWVGGGGAGVSCHVCKNKVLCLFVPACSRLLLWSVAWSSSWGHTCPLSLPLRIPSLNGHRWDWNKVYEWCQSSAFGKAITANLKFPFYRVVLLLRCRFIRKLASRPLFSSGKVTVRET